MSTGAEEFGFDDVEEFHNTREQRLREKAGLNKRYQESDDDSEVDVMGLSEDDEDEEEEEQSKFGFEKDVDSEDEEYFGTNKDEDLEDGEQNDDLQWGESRNNYYGGDEIDENDPEVAKQMEEEALRQQKKHLEELNMDDYMDDDMMEEWEKAKDTETDSKSILIQDVPKKDIKSLDEEARLALLKNSYPEFIPLSKELESLKPVLDNLAKQKEENEVFQLKFTSLSAYLGAITSYFALFMSKLETQESGFSMKDHPVMEIILTTRECWRQANELPEEIDEMVVEEEQEDSEQEVKSIKTSISSSEDEYSSSESGSEDEKEQSKKQDIDELPTDFTARRKIKKLAKKRDDEIDDVDAEEKRSRRRTLRFYTSKIDQAENKKDSKYGGDEDLPYKERLYERQQRLLEEARKRGTKASGPGVDLDDNDMNSDEERFANEINTAGGEDDYYSSLQNSKKAAKETRQLVHKEAVRAAKEGKLLELQEAVGEDGKRAVNYQIMKNKGLTPHRNKDNRNSRVKKRKKYEKAQKKLKSVRAVFSEQQGPYAGEKTGIKKGLSKSVKLA